MRRLDDLVAELRRAGLDVELRVDGELDDLPPGRALAAFRILQEALTNALKHAPGSHVDARLRRTPTELEIEVVDSGGTRPAGPATVAATGWWACASASRSTEERSTRDPTGGGFASPGALPGDGLLMTVRVLLADDQAMVRTGFRMILELEEDIEVVGEAQDGAEAIAAARRAHPDVIVMDVRMPRVDGLEATRRLVTELDPAPRVLVVTTFDEDEPVYEALRAGAAGFLLKNAPPEQLVDAVRTVAGGDGLLAPEVTRRVIEEFARRSPAPASPAADALSELTDRELEVLRLMARGLSNAQIADRLVISPGTAKTHVGRILMKLGLGNRVQAVVLAYETGLVRPGADRD